MADASFRSAGCALMIGDNPYQKKPIETANVQPHGVWIEKLLAYPVQNVNLLERKFSSVLGFYRVGKFFVGKNKTNNLPER